MSSKVEGELGLKISGFQAALRTATQGMTAFGAHAAQVSAQAAEQLRNIAKDTGGGKVGNLIGLAGAGAAVTAFVGTVVETLKKGGGAFEDFETSALQLGTLIGNKKVGTELEEWVHSIAGAGGKVEDLTAGLKQFIEAGLGIEESKTKLQEFQKIAIGTGDSVEELAAAYRKAKAGGLDAGEGVSRFLKSGDMLRMATEEKNRGLAEKRQEAQGTVNLDTVQYGMNSPEVAKAKAVLAEIDAQMKESTADWVKKGNLTSKALDAMLLKATGPGGKYEDAVKDAQGTQAGKRADLAEAFDDDLIKLGEAMSHGLKPALDDLTKEMPKLEKHFVELGNAASGIIHVMEILGRMAGPAANAIGGAVSGAAHTEADIARGAGSTVYQMQYDLSHGAGSYNAALNPTANLPQPGDKVISLQVLEEHAAAQTLALNQISKRMEGW